MCSNLLATRILILSRVLVIPCEDTVHYLQSKLSLSQFYTNYSIMAMSTIETGPKLNWTRDNQMYERYRVWKKKVEFIFCSALADSTPKQLVSYLKYWMADQGIPLIEKWESTGKLDYSNAEETPATEGGRRRILLSGYKVQTYWDLLDEEFKPKGNKLLSIIELWTRSKQGDKPLNQWLTQVYNLVNICKYPEDSTDRIIRDVLIVGCNSNHARDKIIQQGEAVTLNQVIEILQAEESAYSTMKQIQDCEEKPPASIYYQAYDSRSKKSKNPSNEQNSSSSSPTGSKRKCFRCGEPFSRQHMKECRAQNVTCNGCGIKGHLKKCCKKSGNFPKDSSNQQNNQSPSTGSSRMNFASTLPQTEAEFFDEKGLLKHYNPQVPQQHTGSMFILKKVQDPNNAILLSEDGVEIQHNTSTSVSDPDPAPILSPDFPFQEFPLREVVNQSQIDYYSISDTSDPRENSNSSRKAAKSTDLPLKSCLANRSHKELREIKGSAISTAPTQSSRDFNTISISDNCATRKSIPGITPRIMTDNPSITTTSPVETGVTAIQAEIPEEIQVHSSNYRSVIPTDTQALTALQNLISDDFQAKNTHSTQRKGEETPDTRPDIQDKAFQLIQKIHNQLQQVQWDLQRLHSLHKYEN